MREELEVRDFEARRRAPVLISIIALATFGPYVSGGIRTEQIAVYGLAVLTFPAILRRFSLRGGHPFFLAWFAYAVVAGFGVIWPLNFMPYEGGSVAAGIDNVILPLVLLLLIWSVGESHDTRGLIVRFAKIVAGAMTANAVLALVSTVVDLEPILRAFWSAEGATGTTAENAASMGRFSGILNQPAEAGALYSIAGISAVYAYRGRPVLLTVQLAAIAVGGLLTVSKIFVFGGLPLCALYLLSARGNVKRRAAIVLGMLVLAFTMVRAGTFRSWDGFAYLQRLFVSGADVISLYGAGRYEEGSRLRAVSASAIETSPLVGVGAGGWRVQYDGFIAETLIVAGIVGLALYALVMLSILAMARRFDGPDALFLRLFSLAIFATSLGISPLTANRVATVVWTFVALFVLHSRSRSNAEVRTPDLAFDRGGKSAARLRQNV